MGPSQSKTKTVNDIANEFVSNSVMKATNRNATTTVGSQKIRAVCSDAVAIEAAKLCAEDKKFFNTLLLGDTATPMAEKIAMMKEYKPEVCDTCKISDISQDLGITITMDDIQNNTVATEIQSQIMADLEKRLKNANTGTIAGKSQVDAITKIKNLTVMNFDVDIVNETLKNFDFDQNIDLKNVKAGNVSQKMLVKSISSTLISNSMKNSAELSNAVKELIDADNKAAGVVQGVADAAAGVANNAITTAGQTANNAISTAGQTANNAIDTAGQTANNAIDTAGQTANNAIDTAGDVVNNGIDTAGEVANNAIDTAGDVATSWIYGMIVLAIFGVFIVVYYKLYCYVPFMMPFCAAQKVVA